MLNQFKSLIPDRTKSYLKQGIKTILPGGLPDFIIIGAQKAGTSSLHYYLSQHPNLSASTPKEIHYFDRLVNHGYTLEWYKEQFFPKSIFKPQLFYEATPNYIYHEKVAKQLATVIPDIKLILILREPVARAYSAWNMYRDFFKKNEIYRIKKERYPGDPSPIYRYLYKNRDSFPSFLDAVQIEEELIKQDGEIEPAIIRRGFYAKQIENYLKYIEQDQLLILGFQKFINNPSNCINKAANFLGIKSVSSHKLRIQPRNKRSYRRRITKKETEYMMEIYEEPNQRLFKLLGFKPDW
jgi:hypothetical protein